MQTKKTQSRISGTLAKSTAFFTGAPDKFRKMSMWKKVYSVLWLILALYLIALIVLMVLQTNNISDNKAAIEAYQSLNDKLLTPIQPTASSLDTAGLIALSNGNTEMQTLLTRASNEQLAALTEMINAANKAAYGQVASGITGDQVRVLNDAIQAVATATAATKAGALTTLGNTFKDLNISSQNITVLNAYFQPLTGPEATQIRNLFDSGTQQLYLSYRNVSIAMAKLNETNLQALAEMMRSANTNGSLGKISSLIASLGSGNAAVQSRALADLDATMKGLNISSSNVATLNTLFTNMNGGEIAGLNTIIKSTSSNVTSIELLASLSTTQTISQLPTLTRDVQAFQTPYAEKIQDDNTSIAANTVVFVTMLIVTVFTTAIVSYNEQRTKKMAKEVK